MSAIPTLSFLNEAKNKQELSSSFASLSNDFRQVIQALGQVASAFPKPFVFLKTNNVGVTSNINADVVAVPGTPVPRGYKGQVEDFNINFSTVAGTVQVVIMQNGAVVNRILRNVASDTSGIGKVVLDEGQSLAIVGQTAGAGQFTTYCSGVILKQV